MYASNVSNLDQILSSLQCYLQSSRVRQDVYNLLRQIPSLQPNCGIFTHNDGTTSTLLNLEGTIPIFYRGNQYNIPVEFWMVETYPMSPPVCFVRPTADMMVKPGHPHVTSDGFVKIPYITEWRQDFILVELVAHMCSIFGNIPPVFRRPANMTPQYTPSSYGQASGGAASPAYAQSGYAQQATASPSYRGSQPSPSYQGYGGSYQSNNVSQHAAESLFGAASTPAQPAAFRYEDRAAALKLEVTGKIQQEMDRMFKRIRDDIDLQFEHQLQLTQSRENVERGVQSLEFLRDDIKRAKEIIETQDKEVTAWLEENEAKDTVDPDTILIEGDALSKQLVDTLAKHQAIEDALYFMDRALSNGEIELASFLKEVRKLARQQFMCQALIQKLSERQHSLAAPSYHTGFRCRAAACGGLPATAWRATTIHAVALSDWAVARRAQESTTTKTIVKQVEVLQRATLADVRKLIAVFCPDVPASFVFEWVYYQQQVAVTDLEETKVCVDNAELDGVLWLLYLPKTARQDVQEELTQGFPRDNPETLKTDVSMRSREDPTPAFSVKQQFGAIVASIDVFVVRNIGLSLKMHDFRSENGEKLVGIEQSDLTLRMDH
ncbi:hypothetical protein Poli38472_007423 [Pythium oligandrum]|uniref:Tumor susceptibility gene 101 protein n=1 Tax=Pythium oligandrum TaxID=41045 RepID=A0A8K1CSB1_PYTOL|nr:hypothetical protein Poli38472_007423 [Pythium oligandrum]|eukprot:TMW67751.1 hypothetical protein Poli38472_007423 [Pythium oligandrum]